MQPTPFRGASHRILAPDVARGLMLLSICVANVSTAWLSGTEFGAHFQRGAGIGGIATSPGWLNASDRVLIVLNDIAAHFRGLPMFAFLFGYGFGMIVQSLARRGYDSRRARGVLAKRYAWLLVIGVIHCVFLFHGDILVLYSIVAMLLVIGVNWSTKTYRGLIGVLVALVIVQLVLVPGITLGSTAGAPSSSPATAPRGQDFPQLFITSSYLTHVGLGVLAALQYVLLSPLYLVQLGPVILGGLIASRYRWLEDAESHRPSMLPWAGCGLSAAVVVGVAEGCVQIGWWPADWEPVLAAVNYATGLVAGPGIIAAIALMLIPVQRRLLTVGGQPSAPISWLAALGRMSLTGYVMQSVVLHILTARYLLNVGHGHGATVAFLMALGTWSLTLVFAVCWAKAGRRGPVEAVHRLLAYGPPAGTRHHHTPGPHAAGPPLTAPYPPTAPPPTGSGPAEWPPR
ncbi:DUF418 domain-containing protein [Corynebacterium heidelbergense]|uniref:DUF418 domain-containing protein n=1 Tax=Corynebacterium heidelbergense TaxID=2055947 RepID=A0A364VD23_9CORY|nr:DUF418 domain-containing protein [Corynebacterium heidelbergense]RAV34555.1 hypothetical protein CWC39_02525 [Corynebacterium heidelbergense]WCZ36317.1 hypothetical protein CHEID_03830 [Corynebacterium heidelbergense]